MLHSHLHIFPLLLSASVCFTSSAAQQHTYSRCSFLSRYGLALAEVLQVGFPCSSACCPDFTTVLISARRCLSLSQVYLLQCSTGCWRMLFVCSLMGRCSPCLSAPQMGTFSSIPNSGSYSSKLSSVLQHSLPSGQTWMLRKQGLIQRGKCQNLGQMLQSFLSMFLAAHWGFLALCLPQGVKETLQEGLTFLKDLCEASRISEVVRLSAAAMAQVLTSFLLLGTGDLGVLLSSENQLQLWISHPGFTSSAMM